MRQNPTKWYLYGTRRATGKVRLISVGFDRDSVWASREELRETYWKFNIQTELKTRRKAA